MDKWVQEITSLWHCLLKKKRRYRELWCPGRDSNSHERKLTATWTLRVYQFHHLGDKTVILAKTSDLLLRTDRIDLGTDSGEPMVPEAGLEPARF